MKTDMARTLGFLLGSLSGMLPAHGRSHKPYNPQAQSPESVEAAMNAAEAKRQRRAERNRRNTHAGS